MKIFRLIIFLIIAVMIAGSSVAGDEKQKNGQHTSGSSVWQQFKADWQGIGKDIKNTGAHIGQSFKHEFKNMPQNIRNGCKAVNNDLKKLTQSDHSESADK
jgi:predicted small secreted protein